MRRSGAAVSGVLYLVRLRAMQRKLKSYRAQCGLGLAPDRPRSSKRDDVAIKTASRVGVMSAQICVFIRFAFRFKRKGRLRIGSGVSISPAEDRQPFFGKPSPLSSLLLTERSKDRSEGQNTRTATMFHVFARTLYYYPEHICIPGLFVLRLT